MMGSTRTTADPEQSPVIGRAAACHDHEPAENPATRRVTTRSTPRVRVITRTVAATAAGQRNIEMAGTSRPRTTHTHIESATTVVRVLRPSGFTRINDDPSYDGAMPSADAREPRPMVAGGIASTRRVVRRRGGLMAIGFAVGLRLAGIILGWIVPGSLGGAVSFVFMVLAVPAMPILGVPAAGGGHRMLMAVLVSAVAWWLLGQLSAARATRSPVAGWREWMREFLVVGLGLWVGAIGGLLLGALVLGAF